MVSLYLLCLALSCFTSHCTSINDNKKYHWTSADENTFYSHHQDLEVEARIIDGYPAQPHTIKSIVALTIYDQKIGSYNSCGGSLISDRHILTAAHCVHEQVVVRAQFGAHNTNRPEPDQTVVEDVDSFKYIKHQGYDPNRHTHDIAIVKLLNPLDLNNTQNVEIAKLPEAKNARRGYVNEVVQIHGWGYVNDDPVEQATELMSVNVTVIDYQTCLDQMRRASFPTRKHLYRYEICTSGYGPHGSIGGCHGDSGGPLVFNGTLIGVVSRSATGSCNNQEPSVFVSVGKHLKWIDYIVRYS